MGINLVKKMVSQITYFLSRAIKKARMSSIKDSKIHSTSVVESGSQIISTTMDRHSFCGYGAKIKAGVTIGYGAVIGMGSIVTKDVSNYAIVGGNPAKIIRYRFDKKIILALLKSAWWEKDDEQLKFMGKFCNNPIKYLKMEGVI